MTWFIPRLLSLSSKIAGEPKSIKFSSWGIVSWAGYGVGIASHSHELNVRESWVIQFIMGGIVVSEMRTVWFDNIVRIWDNNVKSTRGGGAFSFQLRIERKLSQTLYLSITISTSGTKIAFSL